MGEEQTRRRGGRHAGTQKSEKGKDKGITRGEETTGGRAFLTWPPAPLRALCSSSRSLLTACKDARAEHQAFGLNHQIREDFPTQPSFVLLPVRLQSEHLQRDLESWGVFLTSIHIPRSCSQKRALDDATATGTHLQNQELVLVNASLWTGMDQPRQISQNCDSRAQ